MDIQCMYYNVLNVTKIDIYFTVISFIHHFYSFHAMVTNGKLCIYYKVKII